MMAYLLLQRLQLIPNHLVGVQLIKNGHSVKDEEEVIQALFRFSLTQMVQQSETFGIDYLLLLQALPLG